MPFDAGDVISKLKLDTSSFIGDAKHAAAAMEGTFQKVKGSVENGFKDTGNSMRIMYKDGMAQSVEWKNSWQQVVDDTTIGHENMTKKMIASQGDMVKRSGDQTRMWSRDWWQGFGRVAIGFTIAYRAMNALEEGLRRLVGFFVSGRQVIDDFKVGVIEVAASLQAMNKAPSTESFQAYMEYADWAYREVETISIKHFTTAQQIQALMTKLITQGMAATTSSQLETIARLSDFIVINTRGVVDIMSQMRTETEALVKGEKRKGAVAQERFAAIIPGYKEELKKIRQITDANERSVKFFDLIEKGLIGVAFATDEVLGTHKAWSATIDTIIKKIQRAALAEMYKDILNILIGIKDALFKNNNLTKYGKKLVEDIHSTWLMVYITASSVWDMLKLINDVAKDINKSMGGKEGGIIKILMGWVALLDSFVIGLEQAYHLLRAVNALAPSPIKAVKLFTPGITPEELRKIRAEFKKSPKDVDSVLKVLLKSRIRSITSGVKDALNEAGKEFELAFKGGAKWEERMNKLFSPLKITKLSSVLSDRVKKFMELLQAGAEQGSKDQKRAQTERERWIDDTRELKNLYDEMSKIMPSLTPTMDRDAIDLMVKIAEARAKALEAPKGLGAEWLKEKVKVLTLDDTIRQIKENYTKMISDQKEAQRVMADGYKDFSAILDGTYEKSQANQKVLDMLQSKALDPMKIEETLKRYTRLEEVSNKATEIASKTGESYNNLMKIILPLYEQQWKLEDLVSDSVATRKEEIQVVKDAQKVYDQLADSLARIDVKAKAGGIITDSDINRITRFMTEFEDLKEKLAPIASGFGGVSDNARKVLDLFNEIAKTVASKFPGINNQILELRVHIQRMVEDQKKLLAASEDANAGIAVAFMELGAKQRSWAESWYDITKQSLDATEGAVVDFLDAVLVNHENFGSAFMKLWFNIVNSIARIYIEEMAKIAMIKLGINLASLGAGAEAGAAVESLPALQHGGVITHPTIVLAGEKGNEAIIPLSRMGDYGSNNYNVNIYAQDPSTFASYMYSNRDILAGILSGMAKDNHPMRGR